MGNGDCDNMTCVKSEEKSEQNEFDGMNNAIVTTDEERVVHVD